jgi:hypothetical protein
MLAVDTCTPSKLAEVVTLFNCIQEVPSLNFSWNINYPDGDFYCFPLSLHPKNRIAP